MMSVKELREALAEFEDNDDVVIEMPDDDVYDIQVESLPYMRAGKIDGHEVRLIAVVYTDMKPIDPLDEWEEPVTPNP